MRINEEGRRRKDQADFLPGPPSRRHPQQQEPRFPVRWVLETQLRKVKALPLAKWVCGAGSDGTPGPGSPSRRPTSNWDGECLHLMCSCTDPHSPSWRLSRVLREPGLDIQTCSWFMVPGDLVTTLTCSGT